MQSKQAVSPKSGREPINSWTWNGAKRQANRLGLLVWAEPPCVGRYSPEATARFEAQLAPMVVRDGNHPSIVMWGIYNEEWELDWRTAEDSEKQEAVRRAYNYLASLDRSRPIIDDSGWSHVKTDILD